MSSTGTGLYETQAKCEKEESPEAGLNWEWEGDLLTGETWALDVSSLVGLMLSTPGALHIECNADSGSFTELTLNADGTQLFKGSIKFTGCKELSGGTSCNSTSPLGGAGEIITTELDGKLVYLKKAKTVPVGIVLEPAAGKIFTTLSCAFGIIKENVEGSVIGESTTAVNKPIASGELAFAETVEKNQQWEKIEEEAANFKLTAFGEAAALTSKETLELLVGGVKVQVKIDA
ncbi:MAG TPA: hypothetical protein VGI26_09035 [Solirubrobacteraceae bacterium]|jgi:hypothetical protein